MRPNPGLLTITDISYDIHYMAVDATYASKDLEAISTIETDAAGDAYVVCRLTNGTDVDAYDPTVAFGLYTDTNKLVYADGTTLKDVGIPAGGTVLVRFDIDSAFISQWKSYNAMPTQAMVSAAFRNDED